MSERQWTVRELRRRWKPVKESIAESADHEPLRIRVHRCFSWLQHVEAMPDDGPLDGQLIFRWIALNSLYGTWDAENREPIGDRKTLSPFLERLLHLDADQYIANELEHQRDRIMQIFSDEHIVHSYWKEPTPERAIKSRRATFDARTWYHEQRYGGILHRLVERVYLLRCQLVHGAATHGSNLNRDAIARCNEFLGGMVPAMLLVIIDHGRDKDWGTLCYPPLRDQRR